MKITEIINSKAATLSFEVFPPKTKDNYDTVRDAALQIAVHKPDFMSVTYGAGGGTSSHTIDIATELQEREQVPVLAHLTCAVSSKAEINQMIKQLKAKNIKNILALRGDLPVGATFSGDYHYAAQLVADIKAMGDFCIGGACYPEGHPESDNLEIDIRHLKEKVDVGCDFLTTQMFFDNNILYNYLYRIREQGIYVPVLAGIMPVTNKAQIKRICQLSGTNLPVRFKAIVDKFGDNPKSMYQAGIAYATEQIIDLLANGIQGIHVYSMNRPEIAENIKMNLSEIL